MLIKFIVVVEGNCLQRLIHWEVWKDTWGWSYLINFQNLLVKVEFPPQEDIPNPPKAIRKRGVSYLGFVPNSWGTNLPKKGLPPNPLPQKGGKFSQSGGV